MINDEPLETGNASADWTLESSNCTDITAVLQQVGEVIMPVWPLKDYVAVNPYFGLADRSFLEARDYLRGFSDCETLMPLSFYSSLFSKGKFQIEDIDEALEEVELPQAVGRLTSAQIVDLLRTTPPGESLASAVASNSRRQVRSLAEHAAQHSLICWTEAIRDEIAKFCSHYFDEGQARWGSAWKQMRFFEAWKKITQIDRNLEVLGLQGLRRLVAQLPDSPSDAIVCLLERMRVPAALWPSVLLCQVFSVVGWSAWAKYQDESKGHDHQHFIGLLAIRLAYDLAVGETYNLKINWGSYLRKGQTDGKNADSETIRQEWIRYVLLRASEIRYCRNLLCRLPSQTIEQPSSSLAQMVFCIDVRSERIRRHIEQQTDRVETFGFAGFFGVPMQYSHLGEPAPTAQLPVLLKPAMGVRESFGAGDKSKESTVIEDRLAMRTWRKTWMGFQTASVSCFGFVETTGLLAAGTLLYRSLSRRWTTRYENDGIKRSLNPPVPSLDFTTLAEGESICHIQLAANILNNLGLNRNFARLVVMCGHQSETENNPLAASLDCGACGGHGGAPNARFAALLLNDFRVRSGLRKRGVHIPDNTRFMAALHNTTTDEIQFFVDSDLSPQQFQDLVELKKVCQQARQATLAERTSLLNSRSPKDLLRRSRDWSEVRPEWALAGNAAFVVGPRSMTKGAKLNGTTFLHSYDANKDPDGAVLETIMTAPMIVANWINMQYYASTVDNKNFGSGTKTLHNVVGQFGILSGNSGDLQTGLPWQSIHNGVDYQHLPMRLLVVIFAKHEVIERIIRKHSLVFNLVTNGWLHIVAVEDGRRCAFNSDGSWRVIDSENPTFHQANDQSDIEPRNFDC